MSTVSAKKLSLAFALERPRVLDRVTFGGWLFVSLLGLLQGYVLLFRNGADVATMPCLLLLVLFAGGALAYVRWRTSTWPRDVAAIVAMSVGSLVALFALPEYLYGHNINGIIHRSAFSSLFLLGLGTLSVSASLSRTMGSTPSARDNSRYVLVLVPISLALIAYGMLLYHLFDRGLPDLSWHAITTPYTEKLEGAAFARQAGMRNQIYGTFLLVGLTSAFAFLPGVGAGVFMNEYPGRLAHVVRFATTMLRAISPFLLAVVAFSLVQLTAGRAAGDPLSELIRGSYRDTNGFQHASKGSFLTAALFLSLLVMPVIARATEEGLRSVPREIREGSVALGATDGHGLLRILLPWAAPNIVTGVLLGAAEAAGSVAVLLLIAGTGQNGVGPLKEATSLSFAIFETRYGPKAFQDSMSQYRFTAALLLIALTLSLTVVALFLKARLGRRYRGALTAE